MENKLCDKHDECIGRIHDDIKKIEVSNAKIDGFITSVNSFVNSLQRDVYSKDGIIPKLMSQGNQISIQWGLIGAIIVAVIITLFRK